MANTPAQVALDEFGLGDIVETAKGAKFWGEIIAFDTDGESPGCTVRAIDPGFEGTKHVYPLKQLRRRAVSSLSGEAGDDGQGALVERLKREAQSHAQEARTANATIAEIYQAVSEGRGEPGNWHGAEPVKAALAALRSDKKLLRTFAHEATKAITGLTAGGSEYFGGEVDGIYLADLPLCVERIRERFATPRQKAAERRLAEQGQVQGEAQRIADVIAEESANGAACGWKACSGCHETNEGYETGRYPYSALFGFHVGFGCNECGGLGAVWEYWDKASLDEMVRDVATPPSPEPDAELGGER